MEIVVFNQTILAVLDTGASQSVFDESFLTTHVPNLQIAESLQANTIFSAAETKTLLLEQLKVGRLSITNYQAVALDLSAVNNTYAQLGHPQIGAIIGGDILVTYRAKIDYGKMVLRLYN